MALKLTKRKGFNFFRSYYDVYNELDNKSKVQFIDALLDRQFLGTKPDDLKGMASFAYISQTNSIDSQVKGYEDKTNTKLCDPPTVGVKEKPITPTLQVEEKGEEEVKGESKEEPQLIYPFESDEFIRHWGLWKTYKKEEYKFNYKSLISEQAALTELGNLSNFIEDTAIKIINQSLAKGYKGLFEISKSSSFNKPVSPHHNVLPNADYDEKF
jgi:hypothetical protein